MDVYVLMAGWVDGWMDIKVQRLSYVCIHFIYMEHVEPSFSSRHWHHRAKVSFELLDGRVDVPWSASDCQPVSCATSFLVRGMPMYLPPASTGNKPASGKDDRDGKKIR